MDLANHVVEPNADFRVAEEGAWLEIVALRPIEKDQEVTFSYSGAHAFATRLPQLHFYQKLRVVEEGAWLKIVALQPTEICR